jgi:hypothetical protein
MKTYYLTDGSEVFNSEDLESWEVSEKQKEADESTGGTFYWVDEKPELPYADTFRHISREDMAFNRG